MVEQLLIDKVSDPQFSGLPEWQVAELLNAPDPALPTTKKDTENHVLIKFLVINQIWPIVSYKANDQPVNETDNPLEIKLLCKSIYDYLTVSDFTEATDPAVYATITGFSQQLQLLGLATEQMVSDFLALFEQQQSWAQANNIEVTARTVGLARGAI